MKRKVVAEETDSSEIENNAGNAPVKAKGGAGKFFSDLVNSMFPPDFTCELCGVETFGGNLCPDCIKTVSFNDGDVCPVCGRKTFRPEICMECKSKPPVFTRAVSPLVYENGTVILISKFKNGRRYLKDYFAGLIFEKLKDLPAIDCIVYVPLTGWSLFKRGYNQSRALAQSISRLTGIPVIKDALQYKKKTKAQKGLSREEREENVKGAYKVTDKQAIAGKSVLLIDDVLTTGATADEVSRVLLSAGAMRVFLATVASVEYASPTQAASKSKINKNTADGNANS